MNKQAVSQGKIRSTEHCLMLQRWQGPLHIKKVKLYEIVFVYSVNLVMKQRESIDFVSLSKKKNQSVKIFIFWLKCISPKLQRAGIMLLLLGFGVIFQKKCHISLVPASLYYTFLSFILLVWTFDSEILNFPDDLMIVDEENNYLLHPHSWSKYIASSLPSG